MVLRTLVVGAILAALVFPVAQAQAIVLDLGVPAMTGEGSDGLHPAAGGRLAIPWTLTFDNLATAAAELGPDGSPLAFALQCDLPLTGEAEAVLVSLEAGKVAYAGTAEMVLRPEAITGYLKVPCEVAASFDGDLSDAQDSVPLEVPVLYEAKLDIQLLGSSRSAGPQKQIPFEIVLNNEGDGPMLVHFELASGRPGGKWQVLLPEAQIIDGGQTGSAIVVVATDYANGFNSGAIDVTVNAVAMNPNDPEQTRSFPVDLEAGVRGFYVPGPTPALLVLALGVTVALLRRRA